MAWLLVYSIRMVVYYCIRNQFVLSSFLWLSLTRTSQSLKVYCFFPKLANYIWFVLPTSCYVFSSIVANIVSIHPLFAYLEWFTWFPPERSMSLIYFPWLDLIVLYFIDIKWAFLARHINEWSTLAELSQLTNLIWHFSLLRNYSFSCFGYCQIKPHSQEPLIDL